MRKRPCPPDFSVSSGENSLLPAAPCLLRTSNARLHVVQAYPAGVYTLSVVRLADPLHAIMGMLNVSVGKQTWTVCGSNSTQLGATNSSSGQPACDPSQPMKVNVSANADVVMLQPTLLMPGVSLLHTFIRPITPSFKWPHQG